MWEIQFLMLLSKVISKYNPIAAIIAVFLKDYSDELDLFLKVVCISEFWSILQESWQQMIWEGLSCVNSAFTIGHFLFADFVFLIMLFSDLHEV